tara:strand:+ start:455 stop:700 length:246 start_codon:yes stop_codon:yes gene_type:complete
MDIKTFDNEAFCVDAESFFHLWCCDCNLRHLVVIEAIGDGADVFKKKGGKVAIAMARDDIPTKFARKNEKIVLYKRKDVKK